jgi:hypothetical protein
MKERKYRSPKAKEGELKAQWGKLPDDIPDLCYAWGEGVPSCDARLIDWMLSGNRYDSIEKEWMPSFLEEFKTRGYDITTLKFSIQKIKE